MEPAVLDSDATYQQTGLDFKEMGFEVLDARAEARICAVLGVPPILVGAKVGLDRSTFSNAEQAEKYFWQHTLMPVYKRIRDELQSDLASEFGSDVELRWDLSEVGALQEDQGKVWERARAGASAGIITINEARDQMGLPAVRNGDVFIRTLTMMEVPALIGKGAKALDCGHEHKAGEAPDDDDRRKAERALQRDMEAYFKAQLGRIKEAV
jgi:phage portal protein BeeE